MPITDHLKKWRSEPNRAGWWWCIPHPDCEWHREYREGCVVYVGYDDGLHSGYDFNEEHEGLYVRTGLGGDSVGFSGGYTGDVFGLWLGPLDRPPLNHERTIRDAEILSFSSSTNTSQQELFPFSPS